MNRECIEQVNELWKDFKTIVDQYGLVLATLAVNIERGHIQFTDNGRVAFDEFMDARKEKYNKIRNKWEARP